MRRAAHPKSSAGFSLLSMTEDIHRLLAAVYFLMSFIVADEAERAYGSYGEQLGEATAPIQPPMPE